MRSGLLGAKGGVCGWSLLGSGGPAGGSWTASWQRKEGFKDGEGPQEGPIRRRAMANF